jgi:hypothetical protein
MAHIDALNGNRHAIGPIIFSSCHAAQRFRKPSSAPLSLRGESRANRRCANLAQITRGSAMYLPIFLIRCEVGFLVNSPRPHDCLSCYLSGFHHRESVRISN